MKHILIALLLIGSPLGALAQKHQLWADAGISGSQFQPGLSATYNYKLLRWFGLGPGVQGYSFFPTRTHPHQFVPAVFADLRFNIRPAKKNQFFAFLDLGINFYKHTDKIGQDGNLIYRVNNDNGVYTGLGLGYFRVLTKRGWGPYGSLKMISNNYRADTYHLLTQEERSQTWSRGTVVLSLGFRF